MSKPTKLSVQLEISHICDAMEAYAREHLLGSGDISDRLYHWASELTEVMKKLGDGWEEGQSKVE